MDFQTVTKEAEDRMRKTLDALGHQLASVRTGRANAGMVENIRVDYYGTATPIRQLANITIPEPRLIVIGPWDASALKAVEKALNESDLGIAPVIDGKQIRLAVPALTRERREELVKIVHKVAEESRVSIRSVRRDANDRVKQLEKDKTITEDERTKTMDAIQKLTDKYIQMIDQAQSSKEKELTQN
ncbi:MAG: ribosome recycling factor [Candidatus Omnitrophica bacterium]|nr:ribosome recycling factor [Candidatus Omnitrophota bacterium]